MARVNQHILYYFNVGGTEIATSVNRRAFVKGFGFRGNLLLRDQDDDGITAESR